jgi:hypothetical protein
MESKKDIALGLIKEEEMNWEVREEKVSPANNTCANAAGFTASM